MWPVAHIDTHILKIIFHVISFFLIYKLELFISLSSYLNTIYPIFSIILIDYHMHQASFPTLGGDLWTCPLVYHPFSGGHLLEGKRMEGRKEGRKEWKEGRRRCEREGGREGKRRKTDLWAGCFSPHPPLPSPALQIQFSHSVMSNSLRPSGLQHARLPCLLPTPGTYWNSCLLSRWCHPTISTSVVPFSSSHQSFPASGSFPMSQFFPSGGQSIGVSASASVLPVNIQDWFPLGWLVGSPCPPRDSQESSLTGAQLSL